MVFLWFCVVSVCFSLKNGLVVRGMFWVGLVGLDRLMPSINKFRLFHVVSRCFHLFFVYVVQEIVQVV